MVALAIVPVLLAPWWLPALLHGAGVGLLLDGGLLPAPTPDGTDLALGRFHDLGAPWWLGLVLPALAVLALVPRRTRIPVLICWVVALLASVAAAALGAFTFDLAAVSTAPGLGFLVVVVQAALITAVVLGALGPEPASRAPTRRWPPCSRWSRSPYRSVGWRGSWWTAATSSSATGTAASRRTWSRAPSSAPEHGILVVRGSVHDGLTYTVRRDDGVTTGEDEVLVLTAEDSDFTALVRGLVSRPTPDAVDELASRGIEYVVLPAPADGEVAAALDATGGLVQASAEDRSTRAWQVDRPLSSSDLDGPRSWLRIGLLVLQGLAILVVLVLCAPSTDRAREGGRR